MEGGHHQHIGGVGEAAKRISRHQFAVERDISGHFAVIFKIDPFGIENTHGLLHPQRAFALRMAEGGKGQHGHARLISKPARHACRLNGNLGNFLGGGHFMNRRIRHHHGPPARQHKADTNHRMAGFGVNQTAHLFQTDGEIAGDARHHRIRIAEPDHGGGKMIAVLIDQALAVTEQKPLALQPVIEKLRIGHIAMRERRIADFNALVLKVNAGQCCNLGNAVFTAHQNGAAIALIDKGHGGADDLFLLALGKNHALGVASHPLDNALQCARYGVSPRRKLRLIGGKINNRLFRHAAVHRSSRHRHRNHMDQARVEGHWDDIVPAKPWARALIGSRHLVGDIFARQSCQRQSCRNFHLHIDRGGAHIQRPAENIGKAQHIIDLIGIIRAACCDNHIVAHGMGVFGRDFRVRIGHGKNNRVRRHAFHHI